MKIKYANLISLVLVVLMVFSGYLIRENVMLKKQIIKTPDDDNVLSVMQDAGVLSDDKDKNETKESGENATSSDKEKQEKNDGKTEEKKSEEAPAESQEKQEKTEEKATEKQEKKTKEEGSEKKEEKTTQAPAQEQQKQEKVQDASVYKTANTKTISQLPSRGSTEFEKAILGHINASRAELGLHGLSWCDMNFKCAQVRSVECETSFSHVRPCEEPWYSIFDEYGIRWVGTFAENLAFSTNVDPAYIHQILMDSPSHKSAIVNPNFNYVGIAAYIVKNADGTPNSVYVCEIFSENPTG